MTTATENVAALSGLAQYLEVSRRSCEACIDCIEPHITLATGSATVRFHFVKFDGNGQPKFDALARALVQHLVKFALSARTRKVLESPDTIAHVTEMFLRARNLLRKTETAGEAGELLLFFLLESLFDAPQLVCKMELKTNTIDEVKGSDGIHARWNAATNQLEVFLGESKLYGSVSDAMKSALESIGAFHDRKRQAEELSLVTAHFKHADEPLRDAVLAYLDELNPDASCTITHAVLIGFTWDKYVEIHQDRPKFLREFEAEYRSYTETLAKALSTQFSEFKYRHFRFEFLFLPFADVQAFRDEFYRVARGDRAG